MIYRVGQRVRVVYDPDGRYLPNDIGVVSGIIAQPRSVVSEQLRISVSFDTNLNLLRTGIKYVGDWNFPADPQFIKPLTLSKINLGKDVPEIC